MRETGFLISRLRKAGGRVGRWREYSVIHVFPVIKIVRAIFLSHVGPGHRYGRRATADCEMYYSTLSPTRNECLIKMLKKQTRNGIHH